MAGISFNKINNNYNMKRNKLILSVIVALSVLTACNKNQSFNFPDYKYQTAYFASQYPVRTIELGEDEIVDNSLDNQHKMNILATIGGTRDNKKNVTINYVVDTTLCNGLYFTAKGTRLTPLPSSYYKLESDKLVIPSGSMTGGVIVDLTDAFFADESAIANKYVLPLRMTGVQGADSILSNKNFVLYAVKFVNKWQGNFLRRGEDLITYTGDTKITDVVRHTQFVETDQLNKLTTKSYSELYFPVIWKDKSGNNITYTLILKFDASNNCTISSGTSNVTVTGTGSFVSKGEKKSWGNQDRDALYLDYKLSSSGFTASTKDTLVMRDRAVVSEYFNPVKQ